MKRTYSISIGIPACNEEKNIGKLLTSLAKQTGTNYQIKNIFVLSDASTDKTDQIVKESKIAKVTLLQNAKRRGKSYAIKKFVHLSHKNRSEFLILIDADLSVIDTLLIHKMIESISKNKKIIATSGLVLPKKPQNFVQKIAYTGFYVFEDMIERKANTLYYRSSDPLIALRVSDFPVDKIASYAYLHDEFYFLYALKKKKIFSFERNARAYFTLPKTLSDYNKQMKRYLGKHLEQGEVYEYTPYSFGIVDRVFSLLRVSKTQILEGMVYSAIQIYLHAESAIVKSTIQSSWEQIASTK